MTRSDRVFNLLARLLDWKPRRTLGGYRFGGKPPSIPQARALGHVQSFALSIVVAVAIFLTTYWIKVTELAIERGISIFAVLILVIIAVASFTRIRREFWHPGALLRALGHSVVEFLVAVVVVLALAAAYWVTFHLPLLFALYVHLLLWVYVLLFFNIFVTDAGFRLFDPYGGTRVLLEATIRNVLMILIYQLHLAFIALGIWVATLDNASWWLRGVGVGFSAGMIAFGFVFQRRDTVILSAPGETIRAIFKTLFYSALFIGIIGASAFGIATILGYEFGPPLRS